KVICVTRLRALEPIRMAAAPTSATTDLHPGRFAGKVCLVTGGDSGIGRACCERFAGEGASVVVIGRDEQRGADTVKSIEAAGGEAIFSRCDVARAADVRAAVQA